MTGPDDAVWRYDYDLRGRQKEAIDPDKGTTSTTYDDADQVLTATTTINGQSKTIISDYDTLGRKTGTWDGTKDDAHQLTKYTFDSLANGKLTASIRYVGGTTGKIYASQITGYDAMYQPTGLKTVLAATDPLVQAGAPQTFTTTSAYNLDGTLNNTILPAAGGLPIETVAYTYNSLGLVTGVDGNTDYVQSICYTPYGETQLTTLSTSTTAKQLQISNRYEDGTRRLANTHTLDQTNTGYTSDVDYIYDATGNVTSVTNKAGTQDTQCFAYDGHQRLTEAWTPASTDCATARSAGTLGGPAPYWNSWTYKVGGLRDTQTVHTAGGDTKTTYAYPPVNANGAGQPHALTSTTTSGKTSNYTYDEQGNTTHRPGSSGDQTLTWNSEGDLATLTEGAKTTTYLYDATGELLIRQGPGETDLYLPGQELHYGTAAKKFTAQRSYSAGDGTALRTNAGLSWIVDDRHGTASMVVDATTQQITRRYTKPFGDTRGSTPSTWPDDKGFLGKPADATTGLTHVGAREYDPQIGRFLSVDPVLAPGDHESLNGYAYANNTPVTLSDPSGLRPITDCERGCSDGKGGTYTDYLSPDGKGGWQYNSTTTYVSKVSLEGSGNGTLTTTVTIRGGKLSSVEVHFKLGPEPKPKEATFHGWAMGTNPNYDPTVSDDWIDRGKLATWQKVALGVAIGVGAPVAAAPVASVAVTACLAAAIACAEGVADMIAGDAAGSGTALSATAGAGAVAAASTESGAVQHGLGDAAETVHIFRNVDATEFDSLTETGKFGTGAGQMEGKWFATQGEHTDRWGELLNGGEA
jgi:RHS repeat-associated protein